MKRWIAFILCLLLLLSAGCTFLKKETITPEKDPEPVGEEPSAEQPVEPDAPIEPVEPDEPAAPSEPDAPAAAVEGGLTFEAVTLDGKPIDSSIFKDYDLVILNCWAEWCGPCVGELPELERIHQEYPNVLILGVLSFSYDLEGAKQTLRDAGVTYPAFEPTGELAERVNTFNAIPTTMFFDKNGVELREPIVGSGSYDDWKAVIEELLP